MSDFSVKMYSFTSSLKRPGVSLPIRTYPDHPRRPLPLTRDYAPSRSLDYCYVARPHNILLNQFDKSNELTDIMMLAEVIFGLVLTAYFECFSLYLKAAYAICH